ncbi:hypothetical protein MOQ_001623 [Trypanosoma cruzi marinkellei]|uniref:Uncharacterized protein n=1 Tax=Trypanosoma cruzi marinkellei TaxID=85056 RepID=K2PAS7_TRYCR|nr:hypothetical protein MOQ_001623 [Trypanosoma cruzi marinkellei]
MGAAPSAEILREAPFRPARNDSARVISLIPMTREFFPSPDSLIFGQLYDSRCDPYVRYYMRRGENTDIRLDAIPRIEFTKDEYYEKCMELSESCQPCETNKDLRQKYIAEPSQQHLLRPIPCAVAFLYNDRRDAPEGSVLLGGAYVTVIGGIGCELKESDANSEAMRLDLMIFLRRSAGDHNMVRAMLLASWLFYTQCIDICKLPCVPMLPVTFRALKTNIPFLCFLREMRNRVGILHENTDEHCMWIDGAFICGFITAEHAVELCEAFAEQYRTQIEVKSGSKLGVKPLPVTSRATNSPTSSEVASSIGTEEASSACRGFTLSRLHKQFFNLAGFIEKDDVTISASSHSSNEVYVVCVDAMVRVEQSEDAATSDAGGKDGSDASLLKVRRGDIIRFVPEAIESQHTPDLAAGGTAKGATEEGGVSTEVVEDADMFHSKRGRWQVDPVIHLENVLLSFVHEECKSAREAQPDDPHWLRDKETGEPVSDGGFRIWCFERKGVRYFYGTVPRFANVFRNRSEAARRGASHAEAGAGDQATGEGRAPQRKGSSKTKSSGKGGSQAHSARDKGMRFGYSKDVGKGQFEVARRLPFMVMNDMNQGAVCPFYPSMAPFAPVQAQYPESPPLMMMSPALAYGSLPAASPKEPSESCDGGIRSNVGVFNAMDASSPVPCMPMVQSMGVSSAPSVQYVPYAQPMPSAIPPMQNAYYCVYPTMGHTGMQSVQQFSYMPAQVPQRPDGNPLFIVRQ